MGAQRFVAVFFALVLATTAGQVAGRGAAPRFEPSPCPFPADEAILKQVRCGYVAVPENRAVPDSRRLKLAVAILKSLSPDPRPDPVVIVAGGPGEPFVGRAPSLIANGSTDVLRADREIILYDQRGVAFSEPKFCPELADQWTPGGFDTPAERRAHQRNMAARCGESMRRAGYDLSQYNTVVSAHDLQDLRRALGVKSWNLHGRSYGSRLALTAMRVSPEGIRSVVLDGPAPPNRSKWLNTPGDFTDVLRRLSAECAAQPDCKVAFPGVEQTFWRTLDALQRDPFTRQPTRNGNTRTVRVTPARFAGAIHAALERLQPAVPMLIHGMHARDESVLTPVTRALTRTLQQRTGAGSPGMTHTVNCFDEAPLATPELLQQRQKAHAPVLTDEGVFNGPEGCDALHPYRAGPDQLAAVTSDIPTLIITGEFDFQTHRSNGPVVAKTLRNSQLVEVPGVAHVPSFEYHCTRTMMRDFHNAPMQKVDISCLKSIPRLRFATDAKQLATTTAAPAPSFENAPCPFSADAKVMAQIRCGYVTVPENRAAPDKRKLRLAVAVMKSLSAAPQPDPIVVIGGGPGDRMLDRVAGYVTNGTMDAVRADRHVIVYDQRGVGYSDPKFCPEASAAIAARGVDAPAAYRALQREQLARCGEFMRALGYDLSQYNSIASAHDLTDLRNALGYQEWNLRAASYGTRLALVTMRVAPEGIRSAVLDGPAAPNRATWFNKPADFVDILERLSAACAAQPACNEAFPDVEKVFWRVVEEHEGSPRRLAVTLPNGTTRTTTVNGSLVASGIVTLIERGMFPMVPRAIRGLSAGDETVINAMRQALTNRTSAMESNWGFHYTVNCFEQAPLNTAEVGRQMRGAYAPVLTEGAVFPDPSICDGLHPFRAAPSDLAPVESSIPTLIFTGEFDLQTHRSNGSMVAGTLKHAQLVDIPGAGHVQSWRYECTRTMMHDFYNAPMRTVDVGCLKSIPSLRFLTELPGSGK